MTDQRTFQVRRSELVCPGNSPAKMAKAAASYADQTIFDLEDALAAVIVNALAVS